MQATTAKLAKQQKKGSSSRSLMSRAQSLDNVNSNNVSSCPLLCPSVFTLQGCSVLSLVHLTVVRVDVRLWRLNAEWVASLCLVAVAERAGQHDALVVHPVARLRVASSRGARRERRAARGADRTRGQEARGAQSLRTGSY